MLGGEQLSVALASAAATHHSAQQDGAPRSQTTATRVGEGEVHEPRRTGTDAASTGWSLQPARVVVYLRWCLSLWCRRLQMTTPPSSSSSPDAHGAAEGPGGGEGGEGGGGGVGGRSGQQGAAASFSKIERHSRCCLVVPGQVGLKEEEEEEEEVETYSGGICSHCSRLEIWVSNLLSSCGCTGPPFLMPAWTATFSYFSI